MEPDETIVEEPVAEPIPEYFDQLAEISLKLDDINAYYLEQQEMLFFMKAELESDTLSSYEETSLLMLQGVIDSNTITETVVVDENMEHYQTAEFYGNLSLIVIMSLITVAMMWKFVAEVFGTFTRHIG